MKGIMTLVVTGLFLVAPIAVLSQYDENDYNEEIDDSNRFDRSYDSEQDKGYETSFGNRYEYDLSNPSDRVRYGADPNAQLRDSIDVNPIRDVERSVGEYGGGVLDDDQ